MRMSVGVTEAIVKPVESTATVQPESDVVISARNIGKMYRLYNHPQDRLREQLFWRFGKHFGREFWALRDVSFEVRRGERLGIIGRNGAGKSTLLQILAGILSPTVGEVEVRGRVAALLELGSGFNPEFTGRENVYMNGTVLGLSPQELDARYEAIAAFADIGDFINQPVKLYSSGMLVRLAFAVSTHVDADVLLIDEALAVGDVFFRQKCYKRLDALHDRGTAIVLVSHAMMEVEQFCQLAILLHRSAVIFQGTAPEAVRHYYLLEQRSQLPVLPNALKLDNEPANLNNSKFATTWLETEATLDITQVPQISNGWARCTKVALCDQQRRPCHIFPQGETASFFFEFEILQNMDVPIGGVIIKNDQGMIIHGKNSMQYDSKVPASTPRRSRVRFRLDVGLDVAIGEYTFGVGFTTMTNHDWQNRGLFSQDELMPREIRVCHLANVGQFVVVLRQGNMPVQLLYHGAVNLPGACHIDLVPPADQAQVSTRELK
jgi:lipopolysaccharide transport system ATP-binding protein